MVALAQLAAKQLPGGKPRNAIDEVDVPRTLEPRKVLGAVVQKSLFHIVAVGHRRIELDDCVDDLTELVVRYPEDSGIGDGRVRQQHILGFLGIDVDAPGQDQVDSSVREIEVRIGVLTA